ncbi:Tubulin-specific chaperone E [Halotydeus destructor]|nr:Tubulin-specific chaperone E [Halotydeus destructor]
MLEPQNLSRLSLDESSSGLSAKTKEKAIRIGDRIEHEGQFATVRFVGFIDDGKGKGPEEYIGLDWDNANRGRHNGCFNGVHYFVARAPTSGSFVKNKGLKFTRLSFEEAYCSRYGEPKLNEEEQKTPHRIGSKTIELVGMDKVAEKIASKPHMLDLSSKFIAFCGKVSDDIRNKLTDVTELNLSHNLLNQWPEVVNIVQLFPSLSKLNLTGNVMEIPTDFTLRDVLHFKKTMANVKSIVLGGAGLTWHWLTCIDNQVLPFGLESLELFRNSISRIISVPPKTSFVSLKHLDLSSNSIIQWSNICKLGQLAQLESLILNDCGLESVYFESVNEESYLFSNLKTLSLKSNNLRSWRDIAELNKLKSLEDLNVKANPITEKEDDYEISFYYTVCRVKGLKTLNREPVDSNVRRESAMYYLKKHYEEWLKLKDDASYAAEHPLFVELLQLHGEAYDLSSLESPSNSARSSQVVIVLKMSEDGIELRKKLPASTTISNLKNLARRMFKLDALADLELIWTTSKQDNFSLKLDEDSKSLHQMSIENDDIILVKIN